MTAPDDLIAGRYRLVRRVGSGAMGVVWEAWDDRLHRRVAVKLLHGQPGLSEAEAELVTLRAMREARITARLDHANAVPVFDVVEHEGRPCLIMQFLPSSPLSAVLKERGALSTLESARIISQVAAALAAAHQVGIVHRDVKPGNILIADDGTARISDFGISHALGDATLTASGMVHGTPAYMSPEIARGGEPSAAADVFGLGATLYAMLEGAPPFGSDPNSIALLYRVAAGQFARPRQAGSVTPLLLQMLATEPADRPSMEQVTQYLGGLTSPGPDATPTVTLLPAGSDQDPTELAAPSPESATAGNEVAAAPTEPARRTPESDHDTPRTGASQPDPTAVLPVAAASQPSASSPSPLESFAWEREPATSSSPPPRARPASHNRPASAIPAAADGSRRRPARTAVLVLALLALLVTVAAVAIPQLTGRRDVTADPAPAASTSRPASAPTSAASSRAPSASASAAKETTAAPTTTSPSAAATTPAPTKSTTSSAPSSSAAPSPSTEEVTADRLAGAITNYYALMPDEVNDGWDLLTPSFQDDEAGGRNAYKRYWGSVDRVSVTKVKGVLPDQVQATIRYEYDDGRVVTDRTEFRMVDDDGTLKINKSEVVSSTS